MALIYPESWDLLTKDPSNAVGLRESEEFGWVFPTGIYGTWQTLAMTSDGQHIVVGQAYGKIFGSNDSGVTWTEFKPKGDTTDNWTACATSGQYLLVGSSSGTLYLSSNYGLSWSEIYPAWFTFPHWRVACIDSTGQYMLVAGDGGRVYRSTTYGVSWSEVRPAGDIWKWWADGFIGNSGLMLLCAYSGRVYISSNYGASWGEIRPKGNVNGSWYSLGASSDGTYILVGEYGDFSGGGRLYLSSNTGASWTEKKLAGDIGYSWFVATISSSGQYMIANGFAGGPPGQAYRSSNYGVTWDPISMSEFGEGISTPLCVAMNATASSIYAGTLYGRFYQSVDAGVTWDEVNPYNFFPDYYNIVTSSFSDGNALEIKDYEVLKHDFQINGDVFFINAAVKFADLNDNGCISILYANDTKKCFALRTNLGSYSDSYFDVYSEDVSGETTEGILVANTWQCLQIECKPSATEGYLKIYLDGVLIFNNTSWDLPDYDAISTIELRGISSIDELILYDNSGDSINQLLGRYTRFKYLLPNSTATPDDWTPVGGDASYKVIDDPLYSGHDGDVTYLQGGASGNKSKVGFAPLGITGDVAIKAVFLVDMARKTDSGHKNARVNLFYESAYTEGASIGGDVQETYGAFIDIFDKNPSTSNPFEQDEIDDLKAELEIL